jgi:hypothetical protein
MNSQDYVKNAIRTESIPASVEINQIALHCMLSICAEAAQALDLFKRKVFYGKAVDGKQLAERLDTVSQYAEQLAAAADIDANEHINNAYGAEKIAEALEAGLPANIAGAKVTNLDVRVLHAALGLFTEAGETLEAVIKQFETGNLDRVNFGEELGGDISWYQAIGLDAVGANLDDERAKNIGKLKVRFPNRFEADKAINRDLAAERAVLEGQ